jgi:hypothetical protein
MIYAFKYFLGEDEWRPHIEACLTLIKEHTPEEQ